ncbi:MAG: 30S ribosomal protein S8 [Parcubacteria group bacterium]|nr:30S ribosomal protein S8 [Parcubacteria group bacterium]
MDPIADMLIQIKNGSLVRKESVLVPYAKFSQAVADVLVREGYLTAANKKGRKEKKILELEIAYENGKPKVEDVQRLSKLSRRKYIGVHEIRPVRQGYGTLVLSTPKGVLTGEEARRQKVGGEALFKIW